MSLPVLIINSMNLVLVFIVLISLICLVSKLCSTSTDIESVEESSKINTLQQQSLLKMTESENMPGFPRLVSDINHGDTLGHVRRLRHTIIRMQIMC